jgi:hypothetical protein
MLNRCCPTPSTHPLIVVRYLRVFGSQKVSEAHRLR